MTIAALHQSLSETNNNNKKEPLASQASLAGLVTEEVFYSIFSKFFPLVGDTYNGKRFECNP